MAGQVGHKFGKSGCEVCHDCLYRRKRAASCHWWHRAIRHQQNKENNRLQLLHTDGVEVFLLCLPNQSLTTALNGCEQPPYARRSLDHAAGVLVTVWVLHEQAEGPVQFFFCDFFFSAESVSVFSNISKGSQQQVSLQPACGRAGAVPVGSLFEALWLLVCVFFWFFFSLFLLGPFA